MLLPLVVLLHCYAFVCAGADTENANSPEKEESSESKRSIDNPPVDLCETSASINEECKACEVLTGPQGGSCCNNPVSLLWCHLAIQEIMGETEDSSEEDDDSSEESDESEESKESSEESDIDKRFGTLFSNWQWYSHRNDHLDNNVAEAKRAVDKRYGNLFGSLFSDRKAGKDKRYGMVFGRLFSRDRNKRYGNLMGHLFSRNNDDKRDGALRKRYGSLFRPLFSNKDKRYGSLMGHLYSRPRPVNDKRFAAMEKRYGSLMGRPYSNRKAGRR